MRPPIPMPLWIEEELERQFERHLEEPRARFDDAVRDLKLAIFAELQPLLRWLNRVALRLGAGR